MSEAVKTTWNDISTHPLAAVIRSWIRDGGVIAEDVETRQPDRIHWKITADPGQSLFLTLYYAEGDRAFLHLETAFARIPSENILEASRYFLASMYTYASPMRVAIYEEGLFVAQVRGTCEGFTELYLARLLNGLIPLGKDLHEDAREKFNARTCHLELDEKAA